MTLFDDWLQQQGQPGQPAPQPSMPMPPQASNVSNGGPPTGGTLFDAYLSQQGGGESSPPSTGGEQTGNDQSLSWSDLPGNIPGSAGEAIGGLAHTVAHPIDTAKALYNAGPSGIAQYFIDRYGSLDNAKKTFIKDPVGALLDLSTFATGPEGAAIKLAGSASKIGRVAAKAGEIGRAVDPMANMAKAGGAALKGTQRLGTAVLGGTTGAGSGLAIESAAKAGFEGGKAGETFRGNIVSAKSPKSIDPEQVVKDAQTAARNAQKSLSADYEANLNTIKDIPIASPGSVFNGIDKAIDDASGKMGYAPAGSGLAPLTLASVDPVIQKMKAAVDTFKAADARYHTIGGFDILKQDLNAIRKQDTRYGTQAGKAATDVYHSVSDAIDNAHPLYSSMTKEYGEGKNVLNNITKTFSLQGTPDTILRKLGSTMRSGVFTNFRARAKALDYFAQHGGDNIVHALAGQTLQPIFRSGLVAQMGILGGAAGGFHFVSPAAPLLLAAFSPRLVGNAAYAGGKLASTIVHPLLTTEKAMRAVGIKATPFTSAAKALTGSAAYQTLRKGVTGRGATLAATQAGKISQHQDTVTQAAQNFRSAVEQKAKALGYNLSPRVINKITYQLLSQSPSDYADGLTALSNNKRLMDVITAIGTKGEQQ